MAIFDISGNIIIDSGADVYISALKTKYPSYSDDQLMDAAITLAQASGASAKIVWDGEDINFSGTTHECKGFGGIDFNGSTIYMPNYDGGKILSIVPDSASDITVDASVLYESYTTSDSLKDKVFRLNNRTSGNDTMCLGYRWGDSTDTVLYSSPTLRTTPDGKYMTGELYITPTSGDVVCYNVHSYPETTFEVCNGTIVTYEGGTMSTFIECMRSNTHIHNFALEGLSQVADFHAGVFFTGPCYGVEIDHITGVNPFSTDRSGYSLAIWTTTNVYVHDVEIGDSTRWGSVGANFITNTVFERCFLNRWDNHFAQYGYHVIKDCTLNKIIYGVGCGDILVEGCILFPNGGSASVQPLIGLRDDIPGVFDGNITVRGCVFQMTVQTASMLCIWYDGCADAQPDNSVLSGSPSRGRYIEKCVLPSACHAVFTVGAADAADVGFYENITYSISDTALPDVDVLIDVQNAIQALKLVEIKGCQASAEDFITTTLTKAPIIIDKCDFGTNSVKVTQNDVSLTVANSALKSVVASQTSAKLLVTGCVISGTQSVSSFTAYALAGNIASDMASVNRYSA